MMQLCIRDTLTGEKKYVAKKNESAVSIYLCGVTVYDDAHIGHARTIIIFDILRRHLQRNKTHAKMVQNFTDVDDKIIMRAREKGMQAADLAGMYISRYYEEFDRLNVLRADAYPKATEHIADIIRFISQLVKNGSAYVSKNGVYFDVASFAQYGKLSKKKTQELQSGARIEVDEAKRNPLDFALWKLDGGDPSWDSPWGTGRPGWHIECSAMSMRYIKDEIDIHGGGRDLIFPHHENEIAQSETLLKDGEFARIWMHVGMVTIQGEKMSKSLGNIRSVRRALEDWGPNIIRMFCMSGHYSKPIDYSDESLQESLTRWRQLEACSYELRHAAGSLLQPHADSAAKPADAYPANVISLAAGGAHASLRDAESRFNAALDDDLNTHLALSAIMDIVAETNRQMADSTLDAAWAADAQDTIVRMSGVLGLALCMPDEAECARIDGAIDERNRLRENKEYQKADAIRDALASENIEILDRKGDTAWIKRQAIRKENTGST